MTLVEWDTGFAVGRQVVDATGNATVAALAGARREKSPDDQRQPGSFFFWISSKGGGSGCYVPLADIKAKLSEIGHIVPVR